MTELSHPSAASGFAARDPAQRAGKVVELLRRRGERITVARRAVIDVLARDAGHPNVDQVHAAVEARMPGVHLATIYRTLDTLVDLGVATHVHIGHGPAVYHLTGPGNEPEHLHAQCQVCQRVIDIPVDALNPIGERLAREQAFVLDVHHVALSGTCVACSRTTLADAGS